MSMNLPHRDSQSGTPMVAAKARAAATEAVAAPWWTCAGHTEVTRLPDGPTGQARREPGRSDHPRVVRCFMALRGRVILQERLSISS